jgi:hypothetical protein
MKAGSELDVLIATEIMGAIDRGSGWVEWPPTRGIIVPPRYSKDISAAWQVVEKIVGPDVNFRLHRSLDGNYSALIGDGDYGAETDMRYKHWSVSDTAPHAICLASLKAMGINTESEATNG